MKKKFSIGDMVVYNNVVYKIEMYWILDDEAGFTYDILRVCGQYELFKRVAENKLKEWNGCVN